MKTDNWRRNGGGADIPGVDCTATRSGSLERIAFKFRGIHAA